MNLRSVFIANLKKYRKAKKLSQMKIAEQCGTSASYIGEIEIGRKFPSVEMIERLAETLEISPYCLFLEDDTSIPAADREKICNDIISLVKKLV